MFWSKTGIFALVALLAPALACTGGGGGGGGDATADPGDISAVARDVDTVAVPSRLVAEAEFAAVMAFAPDGRLFFNELRGGRVRVITADGELLPEPFATVEVAEGDEWGLIGLAFDPEYETNRYVYIFYTAAVGDLAQPTVVRYRDEASTGVDPEVLIKFPTTFADTYSYHVAGNIHFGPDGYLWVSLGNYVIPDLSQDVAEPMGSILRLDRLGDAAPENPFEGRADADQRIYAYGLRNSFDFAFHPQTGALYATENGHTNCDELNLIVAGANYGWPMSYEEDPVTCNNAGEREAIYYFPAGDGQDPINGTVAPTGIAFVSGDAYSALGGSLLICEYNTGRMKRYFLSGADLDVVTPGGTVTEDCQLDIAVAPDGTVYYSNLSEIRRLVPDGE